MNDYNNNTDRKAETTKQCKTEYVKPEISWVIFPSNGDKRTMLPLTRSKLPGSHATNHLTEKTDRASQAKHDK